ncbi:hypothetical protein KKG71_02920 [Patescibacteria group bacterium]|nr:hypothetical protein [Patescibacteria group bacterium]
MMNSEHKIGGEEICQTAIANKLFCDLAGYFDGSESKKLITDDIFRFCGLVFDGAKNEVLEVWANNIVKLLKIPLIMAGNSNNLGLKYPSIPDEFENLEFNDSDSAERFLDQLYNNLFGVVDYFRDISELIDNNGDGMSLDANNRESLKRMNEFLDSLYNAVENITGKRSALVRQQTNVLKKYDEEFGKIPTPAEALVEFKEVIKENLESSVGDVDNKLAMLRALCTAGYFEANETLIRDSYIGEKNSIGQQPSELVFEDNRSLGVNELPEEVKTFIDDFRDSVVGICLQFELLIDDMDGTDFNLLKSRLGDIEKKIGVLKSLINKFEGVINGISLEMRKIIDIDPCSGFYVLDECLNKLKVNEEYDDEKISLLLLCDDSFLGIIVKNFAEAIGIEENKSSVRNYLDKVGDYLCCGSNIFVLLEEGNIVDADQIALDLKGIWANDIAGKGMNEVMNYFKILLKKCIKSSSDFGFVRKGFRMLFEAFKVSVLVSCGLVVGGVGHRFATNEGFRNEVVGYGKAVVGLMARMKSGLPNDPLNSEDNLLLDGRKIVNQASKEVVSDSPGEMISGEEHLSDAGEKQSSEKIADRDGGEEQLSDIGEMQSPEKIAEGDAGEEMGSDGGEGVEGSEGNDGLVPKKPQHGLIIKRKVPATRPAIVRPRIPVAPEAVNLLPPPPESPPLVARRAIPSSGPTLRPAARRALGLAVIPIRKPAKRTPEVKIITNATIIIWREMLLKRGIDILNIAKRNKRYDVETLKLLFSASIGVYAEAELSEDEKEQMRNAINKWIGNKTAKQLEDELKGKFKR